MQTQLRTPLVQPPRAGNSIAVMVVALGLFASVAGFLMYQRQVDLAEQAVAEAVLADQQAAEAARTAELRAQSVAQAQRPVTPAAGVEIVDDEDATPAPQVTSNQPVTKPIAQPNTKQLVADHLAAGEFGPALDLAQSVQNAQARDELLQQIATAQMQAGEFTAALLAVRRMDSEGTELAEGAAATVEESLAGGNSLAAQGFQQLITLIQQQTTGPWFDIDGDGGMVSQFGDNTGGISVDPNGLMRAVTKPERDQRLASLGVSVRDADLNNDLSVASELRLVSLTRLEAEVQQRLSDGMTVAETMKQLAGLTAVRYVFVYPEQGEIVIGGPAEPWAYNEDGLAVGKNSGRPVLQLDDLVTVMRTFSDNGSGIFTCSIDPRQDGLKRVHDYLKATDGKPLRSSAVGARVRKFQELLGLQDVVIKGVPGHSRVARVIAEADYRMKLIGIDKVDAPNIPSFFDLLPLDLQKNPPPMDALRWWLTMKYDAVMHSADRQVFEIQGSSVLCQSENEFINSQGERVNSGKAETTNRLFAENFTRHYAELAGQDLVFADLQNVFDLSLVAALLHREQLDQKAGWDRGAFTKTGAYVPQQYEPPKTVMSVVNHKVYNGRDIIIQVAGGVRADLMAVVSDQDMLREGVRQQKEQQLPAGRWWWDAK